MPTIRLLLNGFNNACDYYRCILPYRHLRGPLAAAGIELIIGSDPIDHEDANAFVVYRQSEPGVLGFLVSRQSRGMLLCYDIDDDLAHIPTWSPAFTQDDGFRDWLEAWRMLVDRVFVATGKLAESLKREKARRPEAQILPNLIDLADWRGGIMPPTDTQKIRILWAGSTTHSKDLALIDEPIRAILDEYPQAELHMVGDCPPAWYADYNARVFWYPFVPLNSYPGYVQKIRPHIALCPLADDPFNHCKSPIKWMEMSLCGAATVASYCPSYVVDPAMLFATNAQDWFDAIEKLVKDHEYRHAVTMQAIDHVHKQWSWQQSPYAHNWLAAYKEIAGG